MEYIYYKSVITWFLQWTFSLWYGFNDSYICELF